MNGIDDYFKQYFGGQQQGQMIDFGQYPYRERMPAKPKAPPVFGQQIYGMQGFGQGKVSPQMQFGMQQMRQRMPQQMPQQMPALPFPGQRLFDQPTIDARRQQLMQQYAAQYPTQPKVPSPASQMPRPPAVGFVQEPPKPESTFGTKFAPIFASMVRPAQYGWGGVENAQKKYKAYEPSFEKLGSFYFRLKDYYGDALAKQSGRDFDNLFYDYTSSIDPAAVPQDLVQNFFDWYTKNVSPYQFAAEMQGGIQSQLSTLKQKKKEEEAEQRAIEDRARQLKEWAMNDEDRERRIRQEAEDRGIKFEDRLRQIAREEREEQRLLEDRARADQDRAKAEEARRMEEEARQKEREKYEGTEIPNDIAPYYSQIMDLYKANEYKPLRVSRNNDGTYTLENQFVISQASYDFLKKLGAL